MKYFLLTLICFVFISCNSKNTIISPPVKLAQIVMMAELKNDSALIAEYKKYHSSGLWPEVQKAAQASGYENIKIYLLGTKLIMILNYPASMSIEEIEKRYRESSPKMEQWAKMVNNYQQPDSVTGKVWTSMELIYDFEKQ